MADRTPGFDVELRATLEAVGVVCDYISQKGEELGLSFKTVNHLMLVADEAVTNVASYAYPPDQSGPVRAVLYKDGDWVRLLIEDEGQDFDPHNAKAPDLENPLADRQVGGLGIHLMNSLMDQVDHSRIDNVNRLILGKKINQDN